jgi:hypothetical protein
VLKPEGEHVLCVMGDKKERGFEVMIGEGCGICKEVLVTGKWLRSCDRGRLQNSQKSFCDK